LLLLQPLKLHLASPAAVAEKHEEEDEAKVARGLS
jgi:hypothetical protein